MKSHPISAGVKLRMVAALAAAAVAGSAFAQADKSIVAEHVPAFQAFTQWVGGFVIVQPEPAVTQVQPVPLIPMVAAAEQAYQPLPVILGLPELPLTGAGVAQAARVWGAGFNYQGIHMRQVVLSDRSAAREYRSMGSPLRAGERFKIRITATFDAVAAVDQVVGDVWYGKRTGQIYPQLGMSVQMKAGETVDLPLAANEYFVMNRPANERMVVSVRHASATAAARSDQPGYRQDTKGGSNYLQLVPNGKFPALEQLVAQSR